jgi:hypothetical protein
LIYVSGLCETAQTAQDCSAMVGCVFAAGICSRRAKKNPVVPPADIPPKVEAVLEMEDLPVPVLPLLVWISGLSTHYSLPELSNDATSILCNSLSKFICFVITFIPRKTVPIIGTLVFTSTGLSQKTIAEINTFINQTMANKYMFPTKKQKQSQHQVLKNPA